MYISTSCRLGDESFDIRESLDVIGDFARITYPLSRVRMLSAIFMIISDDLIDRKRILKDEIDGENQGLI